MEGDARCGIPFIGYARGHAGTGASVPLGDRDEEVEVHGESDCWDFVRGRCTACGALWCGTQHPVAVEEAKASFCPNLAAATSRIVCKNLISPDGLTWKTELFSTDYLSSLGTCLTESIHFIKKARRNAGQ